MDKLTFQRAAGLSPELAERWYPVVSAALFDFGILAPPRVAWWIAQVGTESGGFARLQASFDNRPAGLVSTFDKRITPALAAQLGRQPGERMVPLERHVRIAAIVYTKRYGNGEAATRYFTCEIVFGVSTGALRSDTDDNNVDEIGQKIPSNSHFKRI